MSLLFRLFYLIAEEFTGFVEILSVITANFECYMNLLDFNIVIGQSFSVSCKLLFDLNLVVGIFFVISSKVIINRLELIFHSLFNVYSPFLYFDHLSLKFGDMILIYFGSLS